jgi:hypothetical protein
MLTPFFKNEWYGKNKNLAMSDVDERSRGEFIETIDTHHRHVA